MANYITFVAKAENREHFENAKNWCASEKITFSTLINSLLPALAYTLPRYSFRSNGRLYIVFDLGAIPIDEVT